MRITKIIEKAPLINGNNEWVVWVQVQIGKSYQYGRVICPTIDEAMGIREGMILDTDKHKFLKNTKPFMKLCLDIISTRIHKLSYGKKRLLR